MIGIGICQPSTPKSHLILGSDSLLWSLQMNRKSLGRRSHETEWMDAPPLSSSETSEELRSGLNTYFGVLIIYSTPIIS